MYQPNATPPLDAEVRRFLREHGLPERLLPLEDVADASIDDATGRFSVTLRRGVDRDVDGIPVRYATTIAGRLGKGTVADLEGVKAKKLIWVTVQHIRADGTELVFSVGPLSKRLSRHFFE